MDDSVGKDVFEPGLAGTPVKARARYIIYMILMATKVAWKPQQRDALNAANAV